jgi:hypothetical protein
VGRQDKDDVEDCGEGEEKKYIQALGACVACEDESQQLYVS